jgi:phosphoglycerate dehydrogenase-like enzyme
MVDHNAKVDPYIGSADVLITFGPMMADHVLAKATNLKWIQALGTGIDGIVDQPSLRREVVVTHMHGFHGAPVSEAAIMSMLALARDLPRALRSQRERKWLRFPATLIRGKTVGIFGIGAIAGELAPRCKAMGMTVVGITSAKRPVAGFDRMHGRDELATAVRDLDYLVLLTPYTPETRHIVNAAVFAAMKTGSYLVNLARGGVVDETALIQALEQGKLAGAALDVFAREPLPDDHPFWGMDNVIITTHQGGFFDGYPDHALPVVEDNLRKFLAGDYENMINIVKR